MIRMTPKPVGSVWSVRSVASILPAQFLIRPETRGSTIRCGIAARSLSSAADDTDDTDKNRIRVVREIRGILPARFQGHKETNRVFFVVFVPLVPERPPWRVSVEPGYYCGGNPLAWVFTFCSSVPT